ncbi:MAG: DNA mismatch repair endonuclease MutL [Eubacteriales bacterium]
MGKIHVLSFEIANLIAAGEVVDRPASVVKELLENSIDAGASSITVEIKAGGVALIRVADNGTGIASEDLPLTIRRHATSKIREADDLAAIVTLGFRGEALAAIAAVSTLRIITKTEQAPAGTMLVAEGGSVSEVCEVGCATGTTVTVENLFMQVPARRKFLKSDKTEAMAVSALVEKIALSRPDIAIKLIIDGQTKFSTAGDNQLLHTLYALYGREFAARQLPLSGYGGAVRVDGYIGTPDSGRGNRNFQNIFINHRYIRSKTVTAALDKAFTSYMAPGRFPTCCLYLTLDPTLVDVNVHPAKLEVKFSDEHLVFEAVYYAIRAALESADTRPDLTLPKSRAATTTAPESVPSFSLPQGQKKASRSSFSPPAQTEVLTPAQSLDFLRRFHDSGVRPTKLSADITWDTGAPTPQGSSVPTRTAPRRAETPADTTFPISLPSAMGADSAETGTAATESPAYRYVGVLFACYVVIEREEEVLIIDQHAAHERILFEELLAEQQAHGQIAAQQLLVPIQVPLSAEEVEVALACRAEIEVLGFAFEASSGAHELSLTAIPASIGREEAGVCFAEMLTEHTESAADMAITEAKRRERALYQIACKAAIKGGRHYDAAHIDWLCRRLLQLPELTVCPHGRPVAYRLSKAELDKQFGRV